MPVRRDGGINASASKPTDPGVAVYFVRKNQNLCFACDRYNEVWKNLRAIQKTIDAMRGIERWGSAELLDRAFTGFAALPAPGIRNWWEVLGVNRDAMPEEIKARFRELAKRHHPDNGGSADMMAEINNAYQEGIK